MTRPDQTRPPQGERVDILSVTDTGLKTNEQKPVARSLGDGDPGTTTGPERGDPSAITGRSAGPQVAT